MHKCPSGKNTQINRNERYGAIRQQNVASMSSAKKKAKGFAAKNDKRTRILAKQAILRELTRDTDLLIEAHGLQLKQRDETDDTGGNPYGQPQFIPEKEQKKISVKQSYDDIPSSQRKLALLAKKRTGGKKQISKDELAGQYSYSWDQHGRLQEIRIRFIARKYISLWITRVFGQVHPALARAFFHRKLKFKVLRTWQDIWWSGRKGWKLNIRAEYHNRYRLWLKVWRSWKAFVISRRVKNARLDIAVQHAQIYQKSKVWNAWRTYLNTRRQKRRKNEIAEEFAKSCLRRFAWRRWQAELMTKKETRRMNRDALAFWATNLMSRALRQWFVAYLGRNEEKEKQDIAIKHANKKLFVKAWFGLRNYHAVRKIRKLQKGTADRIYYKGLCRKALKTWRRRLWRQLQLTEFEDLIQHKGNLARTRRVFVHWMFYLHLRREEAAKIANAIHHYRKHVLKVCFGAFRLQAIQRRLKEMRKALAEELRVRIQLRCAWTVWMKRCEQSEELKLFSLTRKARTYYRKKILRKAVKNWLHYCRWRRERRIQYARADLHFRVVALPRYFQRMRVFVEWKQMKRENSKASEKFRREVLLAKTFYKWWSCYQLLMDIRMLERMAILHRDEVLCRQFINLWKFRTHQKQRQQLQEQTADEHNYIRTMVRTFCRWKEFVREQKESRSTHHKAIRHYYSTLLRKAWKSWKQYVLGKQVKWRKMARADVFYQHKILKKAISAWKLFAVVMSQIQGIVEKKVAEHRRSKLRQVVTSWVQYTKDSKKKRLSYRIARKHWKSNLLTKVLRLWREYAIMHAVKVYHRQVKVQEVKEHLNRGIVYRSFCAWITFTKCSQREKFFDRKAENHYNRHLAQKSLRRWKSFAHLCFRIKILQRQSMWFHNHRIMFKFLRQWREQYSVSLLIKRKTVLALWHWSRVLQQKAFYSLLIYAVNRKRKAARIAKALEQRRTRMLRIGVTQWMKVAFHMAAERNRFAQARNLKEAFSVQQCVYRCAMQWRRETSRRIQKRGGQPKPLISRSPNIYLKNTALYPPSAGTMKLATQATATTVPESIFPELYRERPQPRKPEYLRESFDLSQVVWETTKTQSVSKRDFTAPEARVVQETTDEAEPRPPPPPPSPQHKLHKHPHSRTPGEDSIMFGPSSEDDNGHNELNLVLPSVSQLQTRGLQNEQRRNETNQQEQSSANIDVSADKMRLSRVNFPRLLRQEKASYPNHPNKQKLWPPHTNVPEPFHMRDFFTAKWPPRVERSVKPKLLPPSSFSLARKAEDGELSGQTGRKPENIALDSQGSLRASGSTLPQSSPPSLSRSSSDTSLTPSPENRITSHFHSHSPVFQPGDMSLNGNKKQLTKEKNGCEQTLGEVDSQRSLHSRHGTWCSMEHDEPSKNESEFKICREGASSVSSNKAHSSSTSFLKDESIQQQILRMRDVLQRFQDMKIQCRHLQKEKDDLLQHLHDAASSDDEDSAIETREMEQHLQSLTLEIARLSEKIAEDRPTIERIAQTVQQLVKAAGIT